MKNLIVNILALFAISAHAGTYEGPNPLTNIKVDVFVSFDSSKRIYTYSYKLTNPATNNGDISSVKIVAGTDLTTDVPLSSDGLTQCARFSNSASQHALKNALSVPVGSAAPYLWSCSYAQIDKSSLGAFSWGATRGPALLKPGNALDGFALTSYGIPGLRQVIVEPMIYVDALPESYEGNLEATIALENKVKWTGQTIGPKAPPKTFDGGNFIAYLITLVNQSRTQGWIDNDGIVNSLLAKLNTAQSKVSSDKTKAKDVLNAFMNELKAQNGKHLTSEAYALLYFNARYAMDHL